MQKMIDDVQNFLKNYQQDLCRMLEQHEPTHQFITDAWQRPGGGGGITRVLEDASVIEKGGVNYSHVYGNELPGSASAQRPELAGKAFQAMGVSVVIHPKNPMVPTSHFNVRFLIVEQANKEPIWWFGGGFDLTPYYGFTEDCVQWHQAAKSACDPFGAGLYPRFKTYCDQYFYLKHRNEARGIGGIFFDDFNELGFEQSFAFAKAMSEAYAKSYSDIIGKRKNLNFDISQREFQCYRRGRYVEFNLLYDRGTIFGLQSNGRTESILMSLPSKVHWKYNWQPEPHTEEAKLYTDFLPARDWLKS